MLMRVKYNILRQSLKGLKNNHVLSRIILKNTQTFQYLTNGLTFNLSQFLEPIAHCPLQHLDISYNSLKSIYPGLIRFGPHLTEVIATNNFFNFLNTAFFLEVILHPKLQVADFSRQGYGINPPNTQTATFPTESSRLPLQETPRSKLTPKELLMLKVSPKESVMFETPPEISSTLEVSPDKHPMFKASFEKSLLLQQQNEEFPALKISNGFKVLESLKELPMPLRDNLKNAKFSFIDDDCIAGILAGNLCSIFKSVTLPRQWSLITISQLKTTTHFILCSRLTTAASCLYSVGK